MLLLLLGIVFSFQVPELKGSINDYAGLFSKEFKSQWEHALKEAYQKEGVQMAILTLPNLEGESIESASIQEVDQWQLGKKGEDKGLLFFIAKDERKIRIEVGRGLEGVIPDIRAKQIITEIMLPLFRKAKFDAGMHNALLASAGLIDIKFSEVAQNKRLRETSQANDWLGLVFAIFFILLFIKGRFSRRRTSLLTTGLILGTMAGGRRGGGGFGGGFGGGGGFSGGGASGSW